MGEHLLRVFLDELKSARVRCAKCGTAIEMSISTIGQLDNRECPGCGKQFGRGLEDMKAGLRPGAVVDRLAALGRAVEEILRLREVYTVEFPVRLDGRE